MESQKNKLIAHPLKTNIPVFPYSLTPTLPQKNGIAKEL